jgi:ABC-type polysaccharide/polyol phosphate export permease
MAAESAAPALARAGEAMVDRARERDSFARTLVAVFRYRELLRNLVSKDLKLKYRGSVLGFLWSLLNPLLMIAVYSVAFKYILQIRSEGFVFYLMLGVLSWTFFVNSVTMAAGAIIDNGGLVKSVFFPRAILPLATVLFNFAQYLLTALVFLPVLLVIYGVAPAAPMLLFPVFLALQVLFTIGVALMVATGTAFFRDVRHFLEFGLAALFWLTPIVYHLDQIPKVLQPIILLTPMSPYIVAYQKMFFYREWPGPMVWVLAAGYAAAAIAAGSAMMLAHEDKFSEQI